MYDEVALLRTEGINLECGVDHKKTYLKVPSEINKSFIFLCIMTQEDNDNTLVPGDNKSNKSNSTADLTQGMISTLYIWTMGSNAPFYSE